MNLGERTHVRRRLSAKAVAFLMQMHVIGVRTNPQRPSPNVRPGRFCSMWTVGSVALEPRRGFGPLGGVRKGFWGDGVPIRAGVK